MKKKSNLRVAVLLVLIMTLIFTSCQSPSVSSTAGENPENTITEEPVIKSFADTLSWDAEYDVVVVGFGGAGAVASITASDEGAKVLLLEKAKEGGQGGNTRVSGQQILVPSDVDKAVNYFKTIFGQFNYDETMVRTMVQKMSENEEWLKSMGAEGIQYINYPEYPEVEGSDTMRCILLDGVYSTGLYWKVAEDNVFKRSNNIDIWFNSPGKELIQDPETNAIIGVKVNKEGKMVNVRAKNGVVLATGGFENNQEMIQTYLHLPYAYPKGTYNNTGDGIIMAMKVGAQLWHMNNPAGPDLNFKDPESNNFFGYYLAPFGRKNTIFVGKDGTRFLNEAYASKHGKIPFHGNYITQPVSLPAYAIFDETTFSSGPIYQSGGWSSDNSREVEKGWIIKADTIEELAVKIGLETEALKNTVEKFNQYCEDKTDLDFGRDPETLNSIVTAPFYAMKLTPTLTNTQGGPKRNEKCEVLDYDNNPIPNLYSAGELGSFYAHGYNGGGNVGETIASGRIAGENAAKPKDVIPVKKDIISEEETTKSGSKETVNVSYNPGTYNGVGIGMGGEITVEVEVDDSSIKSVKIISHKETSGISDKAIEDMPKNILEAQSTDIDLVAGATMSSKGIKEAFNNALEQAKK